MSEFQGWIASLSNGEHVIENPGKIGEKTAWRQLKERCKTDSINVTQMLLIRNNIRIVTPPIKQCDGFFQAYEKHMSANSHTEFRQQGIGFVIGDKVFITWVVVDDNPTNANVFQEVRDFDKDSIMHTDLE